MSLSALVSDACRISNDFKLNNSAYRLNPEEKYGTNESTSYHDLQEFMKIDWRGRCLFLDLVLLPADLLRQHHHSSLRTFPAVKLSYIQFFSCSSYPELHVLRLLIK
jgi:hypothetical protein